MGNKNLENTEENNIQLCKDCKDLIGEQRHTPPHKNLVQTDFKEVKSQFGNVDEYYYKCNSCSKTWLRETGSYGEGWI
ncbi:hypothetical protein [Chryseobacterium sp. CP-77]|uniref:hypothetical protein n=1 Tax=Chryseobacterium sp. CP-77 TaxID=3116594 RepID=UPI002ED3D03B